MHNIFGLFDADDKKDYFVAITVINRIISTIIGNIIPVVTYNDYRGKMPLPGYGLETKDYGFHTIYLIWDEFHGRTNASNHKYHWLIEVDDLVYTPDEINLSLINRIPVVGSKERKQRFIEEYNQ